jgi:hypothetical protein
MKAWILVHSRTNAARHGTALVLPAGQRPLALKCLIEAFGGVTRHALLLLEGGPVSERPISRVVDAFIT